MFLYKRQRLLLTLVKAMGGEAATTDVQKLLFLYTQEAEQEKSFDFVPYKFGCFSFQSYADRNTLIRKGLLLPDEDMKWVLSPHAEEEIARNQLKALNYFAEHTYPIRGDKLIQHVYQHYPYYATRSEIASRVLNKKELARVESQRNTETQNSLFTIGYEGASIDDYLNRLILNNVNLLVDVRRNPLSRKTGFSKNQLARYTESIGVNYIHLPGLGIPGHRRRELNCYEDYLTLFAEYRSEDLPTMQGEIKKLGDLLKEHTRIALTCFEKEYNWCHRHCVAEEMERLLPDCPSTNHI